MKRRVAMNLTSVAVIAVLLSGASTAMASERKGLSAEITYALTAIPGGIAVNAHEATWPSLGMTMTVVLPQADKAVGSCETGRVCAFSGVSLTGTKLSWTTCATHSVPGYFTVRSIANARSSGNLQARNGTTVLASAAAGGHSNVFGSVTNVRCLL